MWINKTAPIFRTFLELPLLTDRPHLYVKTAEEIANEERRAATRAASGSNATPLIHVDERKPTQAKRLSSPERFEIKQLIASGAVSAADVRHPSLDHADNSTPTSTKTTTLEGTTRR